MIRDSCFQSCPIPSEIYLGLGTHCGRIGDTLSCTLPRFASAPVLCLVILCSEICYHLIRLGDKIDRRLGANKCKQLA